MDFSEFCDFLLFFPYIFVFSTGLGIYKGYFLFNNNIKDLINSDNVNLYITLMTMFIINISFVISSFTYIISGFPLSNNNHIGLCFIFQFTIWALHN